MNRKFTRFSLEAEIALKQIESWTYETFGTRQAEAYEEDLIEICNGIANGTVHAQSCRKLIHPNLPENLRFARAGGHFVVFVESEDEVIILDFIHKRSDLPRRIESAYRLM